MRKTPRQALAEASGKNLADLPEKLTVISWVLPATTKTIHQCYGKQFNNAPRQYLIRLLTEMGYLAAS